MSLENLSESSKAIVNASRTVAFNRESSEIDTQHILIAILEDGKNPAARVMKAAGLSYDGLISALPERQLREVRKPQSLNSVIYGTFAKQALYAAQKEAAKQQSDLVKPEHLFLGIISNPGWQATMLLSRVGAKAQELRKALMAELSGGNGNASSPNNSAGGELEKYGTNLTQLAREGKLDPVIGREAEIAQMLDILGLRRKNNPLIVGGSGVGKTALIYALAQRLAAPDAPRRFKDKELIAIDAGSLFAGASYQGSFEERIKKLLKEVGPNTILAIDEIHALLGAGAARGAMDAASLLKPALENGLQCVGTTTLDEYRKHIEKDPALARRFHHVLIAPPTVDESIEILRGLKERYEAHHGLSITDDAIVQAVKLSDRYIPERNLPDKAIDVIDEACSRLANSAAGNGKVTEADIAEVITRQTGIPVSQLALSEAQKLLQMPEILHRRVVGQEEPIQAIAAAMRRARSGLSSAKRPIGSFLFLGPTGVGKTELAKALAESYFGSEDNMIRLDMSEFMERHTVSRLIGSPPGYVGHDEGGQLTEAVRRRPYSVVLFDEVEKAHPDVFNVLLQIMDDGRLTDSQGRLVSFKNSIIILTSNVGSRDIETRRSSAGLNLGNNTAQEESNYKRMDSKIRESLRQYFRPEFLGRLSAVVTFHQLTREQVRDIIELQMKELRLGLSEKRGISIKLSDASKERLLEDADTDKSGARGLRQSIELLIETPLSVLLLEERFKEGDEIIVDCRDGEIVFDKSRPKTARAKSSRLTKG